MKRKLKKKVKIVFILVLLIVCSVLIFNMNTHDNNLSTKKASTTTTNLKTNTTKKSEIKKANITLVGDFLFEQPLIDDIKNGNTNYFKEVESIFKNDDLSIGNMEVVIGTNTMQTSGTGYNFCAPPFIGEEVKKLDLEVLSTANNHAYDRKFDGIKSTIDFFKNSNIKTVGTNLTGKNEGLILNIKDINFGILSYTLGTNITITNNDLKYISLYRDPVTKSVTNAKLEEIKKDIANIKSKSDIIIVVIHWGQEFTYNQNQEQVNMAKFLNEQGVNIIVGSHSHSIQPIDIIGNDFKTLVYYSLGNFVSADDDIARTPKGDEEFDNAYQMGLIGNLEISLENKSVQFNNIKTDLVINYFDESMKNFKLIPYGNYNETLEKSHYRYKYGFNKTFIDKTFANVISNKYK